MLSEQEDFNLNEASSPEIHAPTMFQMVFDRMIKDMNFVGMFIIIYGGLSCLTIIGAILGVPYIFIGMRMREAAQQFEIFKISNDASAMRRGFELQGRYFHIGKILIIVGIVLFILYIIAIIIFFSVIYSRFSPSFNS